MSLHVRLIQAIIATFLLAASAAFAAEGRIEIAGATTITSPGSYILVANVDAVGTGIRIESDNVKLDLNGFTIRQASAGLGRDGILVAPGASVRNIEITNGTIEGFTRHGIYVVGPFKTGNLHLHNLRISQNRFAGVRSESRARFLIEDCEIANNGIGIRGPITGLVTNNIVAENRRVGGLIGEPGNTAFGYRSNVFDTNTIADNTPADVVGGVNLGANLCSGSVCADSSADATLDRIQANIFSPTCATAGCHTRAQRLSVANRPRPIERRRQLHQPR